MNRSGEPRTILVVEDRAEDREVVRRLLRDQARAYTILEAASGREGLERYRDARPDCVLLDFYLPDMQGTAFLDALRRVAGRTMPVPIVMLTGHDDDEAAADAFRRGAQDYLSKDGLSARSLVRTIENAIEKHRILRELEEQRAAVEVRNHRLEALRDELQARMEELAGATRAKDRFLAVMSHEMRTPLNAILGYAELLDLEIDGDLTERQRQHVERIRVGSRHLLDLTNDVLDLTRADARRLELDMRPLDLDAVLEEVAALLERQAGERGIALEVAPCEGTLVHADLQRLRQVITNLVGNAIKFTDEGAVRLRCRPAGADGLVRVEVTDTGIGIEPDALPLVFNEFFQARGELTRRHGGSGLGLAISLRLARLMGGDIQAQSQPGAGSTFTLLLRPAEVGSQAREEDVAGHGARMAAHAVGRPRASGVVVVAFGEDAAALGELERRVAPSVRLVWTTDPEQVAALASAERASLVVLDAGSADGMAWRAAAALQGIPELAATAVLLLPSIPAALPDESSGVLDLGWVSLVPKPFTAEQLTHAVSSAAELRQARGRAPAAGEGAGEGMGEGEEPRRLRDVLVVDDDADSRHVAARFLSRDDVVVREAADGETALVAMRRQPPDVVVLDLMMPVLDGFGVLAAMRADPLLAEIPVVVLTAKGLTEAERQFLSRTAARVLQKGAHRLADVASLVLRAATRGRLPERGPESGAGPASGATAGPAFGPA